MDFGKIIQQVIHARKSTTLIMLYWTRQDVIINSKKNLTVLLTFFLHQLIFVWYI